MLVSNIDSRISRGAHESVKFGPRRILLLRSIIAAPTFSAAC
jgi:hypothetical protein